LCSTVGQRPGSGSRPIAQIPYPQVNPSIIGGIDRAIRAADSSGVEYHIAVARSAGAGAPASPAVDRADQLRARSDTHGARHAAARDLAVVPDSEPTPLGPEAEEAAARSRHQRARPRDRTRE
jgi:hypothetical protein